MDTLTISSSLIHPTGDQPLTPAQITVLWVIADELDKMRVSSDVKDAIWLEILSNNLRNPDGRDDNFWLRKCLRKLSKIEIEGVYKDTHWGAVMIAQWEFIQGGAVTRILVPPAAVRAIRAPETFAKIETYAAYKLSGSAKKLYAALADKKRQRQPYWTFALAELHHIMGVSDKKSYKQWFEFRRRVIDPAIKEINDYGTVTVSMNPIKTGRSISAVRFDWKWKNLDEAHETDEENKRHSVARRKSQDNEDKSKAEKMAEWEKWRLDNKGSSYSEFLSYYKEKRGEWPYNAQQLEKVHK